MQPYSSRRTFIGAVAASALFAKTLYAQKKMRLGVTASFNGDPQPMLDRVRNLGFTNCFIGCGTVNLEQAPILKEALARYQIEGTALETLGPGKYVWDLVSGPKTIGLVPPETRAMRVEHLLRGSEFALKAGLPYLQTHCGFIPEVPDDPLYEGTVAAIRTIAARCRDNGQMFLMETGQETPVTVLRMIQDVGLDSIGVGLDTANLILYGKGNPLDALDVLGKYVRSVHAKDGLYPTDPRRLGREVPIGEGRVDFPRIIQGLRGLGFGGAISIEREISGPRQTEDILKSKKYLESLISE
jgi:L-ribulose-5-phosphate 3-epimerase